MTDTENQIEIEEENQRRIADHNLEKKIFDIEVGVLMGNYGDINGVALPGGTISKHGSTGKTASLNYWKKYGQAFFDIILREITNQAIAQLEQTILFHIKQMEELLDFIRKAQERLEEIDRQPKAIKDVMDQFHREKAFELAKNGRLANEEAETILSQHEKKTGQKIDRSDPAIYAILLEALMLAEQEVLQTNFSIKQKSELYEFHASQKEQAENIKKDLISSDPSKNLSALEAMKKLDEFRQIEIIYETQNILPRSVENNTLKKDETPDDFSFGFPALQEDFGKVNAGKKKKEDLEPADKTTEIKENISHLPPKS
ncbi:MAG: hypothetical protein AAFZ15_30775 [Bacteroidota bacterium]